LSTVISQAPIVGLQVQSRVQSLTLVRGMLSGVAEQLAMDPELLDDLKTSVSEACNNVVLHAYDGQPGPMDIQLFVDDDDILVSVQDRGVGLVDPSTAFVDDGAGGLGVSVMQALARDFDLRARPGGGTEVLMSFSGRRDDRPLFTVPPVPT
jgi:serine/threonine-protein kinase RsbW